MTMSGPPPASYWAKPPEFFVDASLGGRTVTGRLRELGYAVHTLAEVFGSKAAASGQPDTAWLTLVRRTGWVVLARDAAILRRPDELAALRAARVHMFLFEGQLAREQMLDRINTHLATIVTIATSREPQVTWVSQHNVHSMTVRQRRKPTHPTA
ncbi:MULTISPECIES: hypothetical protein [Protofrankia]|uniref:VapC45 PIN like domain-containing protein n=1 Tax=Candidatus Protofrankia datiscae TaxID=2716812 RepID=F8AWH7_9ACTN|nr:MULTISPECIES: hypothetical protein [Protofrankia]AEH08382.1 hypothetical protein FsymDg_0872 [Candidatus Protofrankia datiscae]